MQASRGLDQWYAERTAINLDDHSSVTLRTIRSGEPVQISDTETNPSFAPFRPLARAAGYRSVLGVPLMGQHTPAAALLLFRPTPHLFSAREVNLLTSFANHAAMAIENAALFARSDSQLQEQTRRLEALIQSMQDGLILEGLQGKVRYVNRRAEELTGRSATELIGGDVETAMAALLATAAQHHAAEQAIAAALRPDGSRRAEFALDGPNGRRYLRLVFFDVTDRAGLPIGRGRILQDVTQRYEVDRMKSSLISTVSHELRTPLAAIKGYATTLLADDVEWDRGSQRDFLNIISEETDHLSQMVDDLLDMSRIEAGNLTVNRVRCQLGDLIQQAQLHAHPAPGTRLRLDLPADLPPLHVDARRIAAVLRNLIENAAKYSPEQAPIWIRARCDAQNLVIQVEDEGPGIPEEHSERIFGSFYRLENGLTRQTAGAGLGLAISRGFVAAHGGEIWLEPRSRGTCIAFSLPLQHGPMPDELMPNEPATSDGGGG